MKSRKILFFILGIIAILLVICLVFPKDGIKIGNLTLRFPNIVQMLTRSSVNTVDVEAEMSKLDVKIDDSHLKGMKDSVAYYKKFISSHPTRFYLPEENFYFFDSVFEKMEQAKEQKKVIRILHYGDSQIELDRISSNLRNFFQNKFGGGGPGLLPVVQSIPSFSINQSSSGNFTTYACYGEGISSKEGDYGIMAKCYRLNGTAMFSASKSNNNEAREGVKQFSKITLLFSNMGDDFKATLTDKVAKSELEKNSSKSGIQTFEWQLPQPTSAISLSLNGHANIYGILLDNGYGANVDNIPLRGSSGTIFTKIDSTLLKESCKMIDVGLIILQFGGNAMPGMAGPKNIASFKKRISNQVSYLKEIYPNAEIVFIGPSDMGTKINGQMQSYPNIRAFSDALKEAATEKGAAYWNMFEVMGGENSMLSWVSNNPPLAGKDYIHFTNAGANKIGELISNSFSMMYDFYVFRKSLDKKQFGEMWESVN